VLVEVLMGLIVIFFDGGFFEGAVHALDSAVGPGMIGFGEAVRDAVRLTHTRKDMLEGIVIPLAVGELNAVIRQDRVDFIGHGVDEVAQELRRDGLDGLRVQLGIGKLAGAVDGDEQLEFAFFGPHFGDLDGEGADRIGLKLFPLRLIAFQIRQAAEAMALKAPMQGRSCQVRQRGLQGLQAVIQWQQGMLAEGDYQGFFLPGQYGRGGPLQPHRGILHTRALLPLRHGRGVQTLACGQLR
jgi:hypothetical protein